MGINLQKIIFINNNQYFSQNNGFDFLVFLATSFHCTKRILKKNISMK